MFNFEKKREVFENKVWLSSPTMHGPELEYIKEAYETNWMSTVGANINEVEKIACEKVGCKSAVALSAGTAALHMAVKLAGMDAYGMPEVGHGALEGKKVFCSDMTFDATVNPVVYEGGVPVFIDTEYDTWNMDPVALEKAFVLYPDVRVVVTAHLYGTPGKVDEIRKICEVHDAILIEDAAESLGATYKGRQTGQFGNYNAISFNGNKIITGSAGGMFLTNDEEAAKKVRKWSTQSRENAPWYQHEELGYNYRMSNVIAGVVRGQFPYLEEHIPVDCVSVESANELAMAVREMGQTDGELLKYLAVLSAEQPEDFPAALDLALELDDYERVPDDQEEYGKQVLRRFGVDEDVLDILELYTDFERLGEAYMEEDDVQQTEFGFVRRISTPFPNQTQSQQSM